jgi:class 3 adenylate cyclase
MLLATKKLIILLDLSGHAKAFQTHTDEEMARLLQDYYFDCDTILTAKGGKVIKFIGDGCLATFPLNQAKSAVEAVVELRSKVKAIAERHKINVDLGANLHAGELIEGEFGAGENRRLDIVGRAVNQTFLLGRGAGIRISEPVYRALPSAARSSWRKHKPPAIYQLETLGAGLYEGMGKDPATNIQRW